MKKINHTLSPTEQAGEGSFAQLFEQSLCKTDSFEPGQLLETQIVSISKDCIFLQLGGKSEGVLERDELADLDGNVSVKVGDTIKVFFLQSRNGEMTFTTKIKGEKAGSAILESAYKNQIPVEGIVEKEIKGGYEIKIGESRAFCPFSQMGLKRSDSSEVIIGKHLPFKIQEYKENGRNILVSNRAILEEAQNEQLEILKATLKEKMLVKGLIKSIQDFGAFVDIQGVQALLPISEIARDRVENIHSVLKVGQEIEATIIKLDWKSQRITLSLKSAMLDPWQQALAKYPKDSKHVGKVQRLTEFGAFVTLEPGLDGLIHHSEFRGNDKYSSSNNSLKIGQSLSVQVMEIDATKKRIALRQVSSFEEDETAKGYLEGATDTYNPFAALLGKKK